MHIMASGLQKCAGNKLKHILEMLTRNKFMGIILGAIVTAIIQSSSATTVMVVGFVNAGIMDISQTVGIIMGANIGTTMTSWLVSSLEWASFLKPEFFAPIAIAIGAFMLLFSKKNTTSLIGETIAGFGLLFVGISTMSSGLKPLQELPAFANAMATFGTNPLLGVLVGALVTAVIQSSSASVAILQSLALVGLVRWDAAIYIVMGENIGTCATAVLSGIGASKNAKAASYIHLLFNVIGAVIISGAAAIFFTFINPTAGRQMVSSLDISILHTAVNLITVVLLYPFSGLLVKGAEKLTSLTPSAEDGTELIHLDDRVLKTPGIAIENCVKEIVRLGEMARDNLKLAIKAMKTRDNSAMEKVLEVEDNIDVLTKSITSYMVKLCNTDLTEKQNNNITALFHTVIDMERIGDHCENLVEFTQFMQKENIRFSDKARGELDHIFDETVKCVSNSVEALSAYSTDLAEKVISEEERVDNLEERLRSEHIARLANRECDPTAGVVYLDVLTNLERVSDHALNVAQMVIKHNEVQ
jgi:phosphate:Na+ symporter